MAQIAQNCPAPHTAAHQQYLHAQKLSGFVLISFFQSKHKKILHALWVWRERRRVDPLQQPVRRDLKAWRISKEVELVAYWKVVPNGRGVALLVRVAGRELLKYDFLSGTDAHWHSWPEFAIRQSFPSDVQPLDWVLGQISRHFAAAIPSHPRPGKRSTEFVLSAAVAAEIRQQCEAWLTDTPWSPPVS